MSTEQSAEVGAMGGTTPRARRVSPVQPACPGPPPEGGLYIAVQPACSVEAQGRAVDGPTGSQTLARLGRRPLGWGRHPDGAVTCVLTLHIHGGEVCT